MHRRDAQTCGENTRMDQTLTEEISLFHAQICQGLADPTRILILYLLDDDPRYVTELADRMSVSPRSHAT